MRGSDYAELRALRHHREHGSFRTCRFPARSLALGAEPDHRGLEERLGTGSSTAPRAGVAPSEGARRLLARLLPVLADLDAAVADVRSLRDAPSGTLRITPLACRHSPSRAADRSVPARLFRIVLDVAVEDRLVDIVAERSMPASGSARWSRRTWSP